MQMETAVRRMIERRVEGVAIMTFGIEGVLLEDLKLRKVPLVFVDVGPPRPRVSNIRIDYLHGIRQAVQHLAALRHQDVAFISGPLHLKSAQARKQAFLTSVSEIGLEVNPALILEGTHTIEGGIGACGTLLNAANHPTAVLATCLFPQTASQGHNGYGPHFRCKNERHCLRNRRAARLARSRCRRYARACLFRR
jgi:DNA-binding LacI/PurR family transcriptional regulator